MRNNWLPLKRSNWFGHAERIRVPLPAAKIIAITKRKHARNQQKRRLTESRF